MQRNGSKPKDPQARGKASTSQILGGALRRSAVPRKWMEHHRILTRFRERVSGDRASLSHNAKEEVARFSLHMADAGTDSYDRDWSLAMLSSDQNAIYEIDEALNRIASGNYGVCELTGRPIEPERLAAIPWTRFSAEAQSELEARGLGNRSQLGQLGSYAQMGLTETSEDEEEEGSGGEQAKE